jgi:hypothetical protein
VPRVQDTDQAGRARSALQLLVRDLSAMRADGDALAGITSVAA